MLRQGTIAGLAAFFVSLLITGAAFTRADDAKPASSDPAAIEFFEKKVRPLLVERCLSCHGGEKQKGGLRLDGREAILKGGETGPAAVPGKPAESLLVEAIKYGEDLQMPPKSRLPAPEVETLTRWVEIGMPWPASHSSSASKPKKDTFDLAARRGSHWAWQPISAQSPPNVKTAGWPRGTIDRFVLAKLEAAGLTPAPMTDRRTLIRRIAFDVTGLPPAPEDVERFVNDRAADALERVIDGYLDSPRFGERWARHWLDLVRYAETRGHEFDPIIPNAWQYRDYVIRALNADVPYDQFLTEHLAGDLIEKPRLNPTTGANESILGTGFWFLGEEVHSPVDIRQDETDRMDNRLDVMTKTFLGLTVACARCHDHKFDAISQRDYYGLSGFLISSTYRQVRFASLETEKSLAESLAERRDRVRDKVEHQLVQALRGGATNFAANLLTARAYLLNADRAQSHVDSAVKPFVDALNRAKLDRDDPLHIFSVVTCMAGSEGSTAFRTRLSARLASDCVEQIPGAVVHADLGSLEPITRYQNGYAFGNRPARPGDLILDGDSQHPRLAVFTRRGVSRDPAFANVKLAPEAERDHGRLGEWNRPGQTVRTPDFTLGRGTLYYLARGAGRAYASVNSHLVVAGPLHGAVMTEWTDGGKGWRWVRHDLSAYTGHRLHIEFSPSGTGSFAVAKVIQADREPQQIERPNRLLLSQIGATEIDSPERLANAYEKVFRTLGDRLDDRQGKCDENSEDVARLESFTLKNLELFAPCDKDVRTLLEQEALALAEAEREAASKLAAPALTAPAMLDGNGVNEYVLIRGGSRNPGPIVPRRFLEAIAGTTDSIDQGAGSGRLWLAKRMLDPSDPFVSRVIVNRVWHHLFGRGIVATVDNFGVLGEAPSHPELFDYLAAQFVQNGWSIKRLIRTILLTQTYGMSSKPDAAVDARDPLNLLLHRSSIRRLEAEPIRDAILAISGRLDEKMYGPSVPVHLTEYMQGRGRPSRSGPLDGDGRRSVYLAIRRNFLTPMLLAFDAPIPFTTMGRRNVSNVPAQALILMNDPFVIDQAKQWADRMLCDRTQTPNARIDAMYRIAFGRPAAAAEIAEALGFLESQARELELSGDTWKTDRSVWADFAHVLLNSKEFIFLD